MRCRTRINSLSNDWAARDDPYQRNKIAADRDKALAELSRVQKEVQDGTKAIAAIQEEARKAACLPAGPLTTPSFPVLLVEDKDSLRRCSATRSKRRGTRRRGV